MCIRQPSMLPHSDDDDYYFLLFMVLYLYFIGGAINSNICMKNRMVTKIKMIKQT